MIQELLNLNKQIDLISVMKKYNSEDMEEALYKAIDGDAEYSNLDDEFENLIMGLKEYHILDDLSSGKEYRLRHICYDKGFNDGANFIISVLKQSLQAEEEQK